MTNEMKTYVFNAYDTITQLQADAAQEIYSCSGQLLWAEPKGTAISQIRLNTGDEELLLTTDMTADFWQVYLNKETSITGTMNQDGLLKVETARMPVLDHIFDTYPDRKKAELLRFRWNNMTPEQKEYIYSIACKQPTGIPAPDFTELSDLELCFCAGYDSYPDAVRRKILHDIQNWTHISNSDMKNNTLGAIRQLVTFPFGVKHPQVNAAELLNGLDKAVIGQKKAKRMLVDAYTAGKRLICLAGPSVKGSFYLLRTFAQLCGYKPAEFDLRSRGEDPVGIKGSSRLYSNASWGDFFDLLHSQGDQGAIIFSGADASGDGPDRKNKSAAALASFFKDGTYINDYLEVPLSCPQFLRLYIAEDPDLIPDEIAASAQIITLDNYSEEELILIGLKMYPQIFAKAGMRPIRFEESALKALCCRYARSGNIRDIQTNLNDIAINLQCIKGPRPSRITEETLPRYFSLLRRKELLRGIYAEDIVTLREKFKCLGKEMPANLAEKVLELEQGYEGSTALEKAQILEKLKLLVNMNFCSLPQDLTETPPEKDFYGQNEVSQALADNFHAYCTGAPVQPLLLVSPHGYGKTRILSSFADSRKMPFITLHGENEHNAPISGIGDHFGKTAGPGTLLAALGKKGIQTLKAFVFCDEFDKWSDYSAFYHMLGDERYLYDSYLQAEIPTKDLFMVFAANDISHIPAPILSRFRILELHPYTRSEKEAIASEYAIPELLQEHGLKDRIRFSEEAISAVAGLSPDGSIRVMKEALSRIIKHMARTHAEELALGQTLQADIHSVESCFPKASAPQDCRLVEPSGHWGVSYMAGIAGSCGIICSIEITDNLSGSGILVTGLAKESVRESIETARSICEKLLKRKVGDIHIHFTSAGIPKDGPSAGTAIFAAMLSYCLKKPLTSMPLLTGELSLSGKILPIGGLELKLAAAEYLKNRPGVCYVCPADFEQLKADCRLDAFRIPVVPVADCFTLAKLLFPGEELYCAD